MLERLLVLALVALAAAVFWAALLLWRRWKLGRLADEAPLAGLVPTGRPAVVSFSTPQCAECRSRQGPALARLSATLGESVTVRGLSALDHPELVDKLGILTVPATVVLDAHGRPHHINLGYASERTLVSQLDSVRSRAPVRPG